MWKMQRRACTRRLFHFLGSQNPQRKSNNHSQSISHNTSQDPHRLKRWNIVVPPSPIKTSKEPSFHIYDALAEFFETKFIRPSGKWVYYPKSINSIHSSLYCEKCLAKTPYQKFYRFLNLPNMLCLHLKRQDLPKEQNIKVALALDNFDLAPFVKV